MSFSKLWNKNNQKDKNDDCGDHEMNHMNIMIDAYSILLLLLSFLILKEYIRLP